MDKLPSLKHVKFVRSKGKVYAYFNTGSKKANGCPVYARLPDFGTPGFFGSYGAMLGHLSRKRVAVLTVAGLVEKYQDSADWKRLAQGSQKLYTSTLKRVTTHLGAFPVADVERRHVREIVNNRITGNGARNIFLALTGALYKWARDNDLAPAHQTPTSGIRPFPIGEHDAWPDALLEAALACDDDRVRLATHLLYYTGQRIGDVVKLRWNDIQHGRFVVTPEKTKRLKKTLYIPLHSALKAELDRTPKRGITILTNYMGGPLARAEVIRKALTAFAAELGFKAVPHGLRKCAVNSLLEAGCEIAQVASITGQSFKMVEHYARQVNQRKLGDAAMLKFERKAEQSA